MASEAMRDFIALIIIVVCASALFVSVFYSIPYALRRVGMYPRPGARRTFAVFTVIEIVAPTAVVLCFLAVATVAVAVEDATLASAINRSVLLAGILTLAAQVVIVPIGHRYIQDQAEREAREREAAREKKSDRRPGGPGPGGNPKEGA